MGPPLSTGATRLGLRSRPLRREQEMRRRHPSHCVSGPPNTGGGPDGERVVTASRWRRGDFQAAARGPTRKRLPRRPRRRLTPDLSVRAPVASSDRCEAPQVRCTGLRAAGSSRSKRQAPNRAIGGVAGARRRILRPRRGHRRHFTIAPLPELYWRETGLSGSELPISESSCPFGNY